LEKQFEYWAVVEAAKSKDFAVLSTISDVQSRPWHEKHRPLNDFRHAKGFVCVTGQNINRKHDERIFFAVEELTPLLEDIDDRWLDEWKKLIANYRALAKSVRERRDRNGALHDSAYLGNDQVRPHFRVTFTMTCHLNYDPVISATRGSTKRAKRSSGSIPS